MEHAIGTHIMKITQELHCYYTVAMLCDITLLFVDNYISNFITHSYQCILTVL